MADNPVIMLVDESRFFLDVMHQFLRTSAVRVCPLVQPGLLSEMAAKNRPDLIFLDRGAPDLQGVHLCAQFKSDATLGRIPLILLAEKENERERSLCLKAGCDGLLTKPIDRKAFLAMGRRFLPGIERREERVLCHTTVFYRALDHQGYGDAVDISAGGMFVESRRGMRKDDRIRLSFNIPGRSDMTVDFDGNVVWVNSAENPLRASFPPGFGVEFIEPSPRAQSLIRKYVAEHSPRQNRIREGQRGQPGYAVKPPRAKNAGVASSKSSI